MKNVIAFMVVLIISGSSYVTYKHFKYLKESAPEEVDISQIIQNNKVNVNDDNNKNQPISYPVTTPKPIQASTPPKELNLKMPFYAQAPFGNWDYPWQEACEEASVLLIANVYLDKNWSRDEFNAEILKIVDWENKEFGDYKHTTMAQTADMISKNFGLKSTIHDDPSFEDIKKILNKGHFIIMPVAGKKIGNPFYKNGGPMYHVFVVKGYKDDEKLITHDVGTKQGADYVYKWSVIEAALHDYAEPIENGGKRMIEVMPKEK